MTEVVARLEHVTKRFGDFVALRDASLEVRRGELLLLTGPSGSGKTTCLSILGCLMRPTSGSVYLLDEDVSSMRESELAPRRLRGVGFVFQAHNLIQSLDASDNVALVARMRGMSASASNEAAARLLDRVGLGSKRHAAPRDLSGGERQRVGIARALIGAPPLLLADEPTASLDAANGLAVTALLNQLAHEEHLSVVIVTHDPRVVHLADRAHEIEDGTLR